MTLKDLEPSQKGFSEFFAIFGCCAHFNIELRRNGWSYIIHKVAPRYWRWWRGVVGNAFRLKQSYSTPGPASTAMGDY